MNPSSIDTLKNNFFEIQNVNSSFNQYYHLTSPYNAVIETYRSDLDQPYFKISSFSPAPEELTRRASFSRICWLSSFLLTVY